MTIEQQFRAIVARDTPPSFDELNELYEQATPLPVAEILGDWQGGVFGLGHSIEAQLAAVNWVGKYFGGPDDVAPIVCADSAGERFVNELFGGARLRDVEYRGAATATMEYLDQPMADHFRRISEGILMGAMERAGGVKPGFFYLERRPGGGPPRQLGFRSHRPPQSVQAAVLREPAGRYSVEAAEIESPAPGEVLVRLGASGICHTDMVISGSATSAQLPMVLGHEGAGTVEAIGDGVSDIAVGDRVVMSYNWCGACVNCRRGRMAYCANGGSLNLSGLRLDGTAGMRGMGGPIRARFCGQSSFATYALAAAHTVVAVRADVPIEFLAPLGCGVQTGAGTVLNALRPEPGSSIAIFAVGSVGLSAIMAAKLAGCERIVAVDPMPQRRALAVELGATTAVAPENVKAATVGGVDYAIDCIGKPEVLRAAIGSLASPGVCATIGLQGMSVPIELDQSKMVVRGQTLRGVTEGDAVPRSFIPRLVDHYLQGEFPVDRLVTTFPFERINDAVEASVRGEAVKAVLRF